MSDVTQILSQIESGDPSAAELLLPLIYKELRNLAAAKMVQESPDHTLQATELVHEAYIRLVNVEKAQHWDSRGHFFAAAAEAMRRILVDRARRKGRLKHGGNRSQVDLDQEALAVESNSNQVLAIHAALERFEKIDPQKADLVKLRYFAGMTLVEAAKALKISRATAARYWTFAKAWLAAELADQAE